LVAVWATVLCLALLAGCASTEPADAGVYVVQAQDTLYSIAWRHNLDYHDLARWNQLGADFRISVGQHLRLGPPPGARASASTPAPASPPQGARELPRSSAPRASANRQALAGIALPHLTWVWPTDRSTAPRPVQSGGILFSGKLGQEVRAAAAGRVVYTGNGIRGYGQLVIIKHGEVLLSAYAYNREILVHEGQEVTAGQVIAQMGEGVHQVPSLYFEIRVDGKPIDPLPLLLGQK
jgi:lipoprotein NlpD